MDTTALDGTVSLADYQKVRDHTEALAAPLSPEDQQVQSMPDVSPTKWHRAHVTWFFETFLLLPHLPGYRTHHDAFQYLFNSYYETVGDRQPRHARGVITRPSSSEIADYRRHVDSAMAELIDTIAPGHPDVAALVILGLHHEQQHQELLLMDIKHVLSQNPQRPAYDPGPPPQTYPSSAPMNWISHDGGLVPVGINTNLAAAAGPAGFHFDNEGPQHSKHLEPYRIADRLVTCGDWLEFMADSGYHEPGLWLSEGWATICREGWDAPLYWETSNEGWQNYTLHGLGPVNPHEPVRHISYFEADAFARWSGARLPTEAEWEHAARTHAASTEDAATHAASSEDVATAAGLFGEVWQWTQSSYAPYPGFVPVEGAVGEYNGKFMVNQYVLRGSSLGTPAGHARRTYRNFFPTASRWMFSGMRLAADAQQ